jgi:aspartate dehydrogenase
MSLRRLGLIGAGQISSLVLQTLQNNLPAPLDHLSVFSLPQSAARARSLIESIGKGVARSCRIRIDLDALLDDRLDVVAECASHSAVRDYGPTILASGCELIVISIGALADEGLTRILESSAKKGCSRLVFPAGAVGGVDALSASRLSGVQEVFYTGRKPPKAWLGTPAEALLNLDELQMPTTFFEGTARQAARQYPFNANVASTLALAGIGLDKTQVQLVADPTIAANIHEFMVQANCGNFSIRLENKPLPDNPKTSQLAAYSIARELLNRVGVFSI